MGIIIDIALIAIIVLVVLYYSKKGLIAASKNIITLILTVVLLACMQGFVLDTLQNTVLGESIRNKVSESVTKVYEEKNLPLSTDTSNSEEAIKICESMSLPTFMSKSIEDSLDEMSEMKNNVLDIITDSVTMLILRIIALILLFILVRIIVFLVLKFTEGVFKLPILKSINKCLGAVMGVINSIVFIYIACGVLNLFVPTDKLEVLNGIIDQTMMVKFFYNNNILFGMFM